MLNRHPCLYSVLPSLHDWDDILCALSVKAGFPGTRNLPCHLAAIAGRRHCLRHDLAHDHLESLVLQRTFMLGCDLGLSRQTASSLAYMLVGGLRALRNIDGRSSAPQWPTPQTWLAIDQAVAEYLFNVRGMTVSSYLAWTVQDAFGGDMRLAKRHVHRTIAVHARKLATEIGLGWIDAVLIQWRLNSWLNSFDAA